MSGRAQGERLSPADAVTILNAVFGFLAVALLVRHWALEPAEIGNGVQAGELKLAGALIGLGALCDVADGIVARMTWTSRLGDHLDGMADTITFGLAPALLIAVAGLAFPSPLDALALAAATTHVVAVVLRLARHAVSAHSPEDGFLGVTSPLGALAIIAIIALELPAWLTVSGVFAVSALMLGGFRYPHQTRPATMGMVVTFACLGAAMVGGLVPLGVGCAAGLLVILLIPVALRGTTGGHLESDRAPEGIASSR